MVLINGRSLADDYNRPYAEKSFPVNEGIPFHAVENYQLGAAMG